MASGTVEAGARALPARQSRRGGSRQVCIVGPRRAGLVGLATEFWRFRLLIPYFGARFLQKRFARTWLGLIWLPLRPFTVLATRILVFGGLVGISAGKTPYPIFFIVATAAWQLFYECAYWSTRSLELNRKVLLKSYVPKMVVLVSAVIPAFVEFSVNVSFAGLAVLYYVVRAHIFYLEFGLQTLLVPAGLLLMILLGLGIGLITSGASARARDIRFGIGYFLGFIYFLTPVIYPLSAVPLNWRPIAELNPLTGAVEMVKDGLFAAHELSPDAVGVTLFWLVLIWGPGLWLFDRREVGVLHGRAHRLPRLRLRRRVSA
jgi:lipopolysaccharide transport system permease protein